MNATRTLLATGGLLFLLAACDDDPARPPTAAEPVGDGQIATAGTALADSVGLRVTDPSGRPLRGVEVAWAPASPGDGTLSPAVSRTGSDGVARAAWTLGARVGDDDGRMEATATVARLEPVRLTARARPGTATALVLSVPPEADTLGVDATGTLSATATDRHGNVVTGRLARWESLDPGVALVNETGVVTGRALGTARIRATLDGAADTATVTVTRTAAGAGWSDLDAGNFHTCGVWSSGDVFCWGLNDFGQLGDGTTTARALPTRAQAPAGVRFARVHAALGALTCALSTAGETFCWGLGGGGSTPTRVTAPAGVAFTALAPGETNLCALAAAGEAWCRGFGGSGQLGNGGTADSPTGFVRVQAPAGVAFRQLAHARLAVCGVSTAGEVWCWGSNARGELGTGGAAPERALVPVRAATPAGTAFAAIGAGENHFCAVAAGGDAFCWGDDEEGQAGGGAAAPEVRVPVRVRAPGGGAFASVAGGTWHTCAAAASGEVFCWGFNDDGEVGDGSTSRRLAPSRALAPAGVRFDVVSAGYFHSCGLTLAGEAYCWGWNPDGALGNGAATFDPTATPSRVRPPGTAPAAEARRSLSRAVPGVPARHAAKWGKRAPAGR